MAPVKSWRSLIQSLAADATFTSGASAEQIAEAEAALGVPLPDWLRDLLSESNGVQADYSSNIVWSCAEMIAENRDLRETEAYREVYMPFDNLLFFGADGGGDLFAFAINMNGVIEKFDIYRWDHETDGRAWFAGGLDQYFEFRLSPSYYD